MPTAPIITHALAEQHEALWLKLTALHKDLVAIATRRSTEAAGEAIRITAEALLSDCAPFATGNRLPVVASDIGGIVVQLGQALAWLDAYEARHSFWNPGKTCRCWRVKTGELPVQRLRPQLPPPAKTHKGEDMREALRKHIKQKMAGDFQRGFAAGRAARQGPPIAEPDITPQQTYPRLRQLD